MEKVSRRVLHSQQITFSCHFLVAVMSFGGYTLILHFTPTEQHRKEKECISRISCFWLKLEWKPAGLSGLDGVWLETAAGAERSSWGLRCLMMAAPSTPEKEPISLSSSTYSPFIQSERVLQMSRPRLVGFQSRAFCCNRGERVLLWLSASESLSLGLVLCFAVSAGGMEGRLEKE